MSKVFEVVAVGDKVIVVLERLRTSSWVEPHYSVHQVTKVHKTTIHAGGRIYRRTTGADDSCGTPARPWTAELERECAERLQSWRDCKRVAREAAALRDELHEAILDLRRAAGDVTRRHIDDVRALCKRWAAKS